MPAIADLSPAACAALLAERFPALFGAARVLPIKLRIQADIQLRAPGLFNKKSLSIFLHRYTTGTPYIKALLNSPQRLDLDGQPAGEVAQEHRDAANTEMARRLAIVQARRAAERDAVRASQRAPQRSADAAAGALPAPPVSAAPPLLRPPRPAQPERQDRAPRAPRPHRAPRSDLPPRAHPVAQGDAAPRPQGPARAECLPQRGHASQGQQRAPHPPRGAPEPAAAPARVEPGTHPSPRTPEQAAQLRSDQPRGAPGPRTPEQAALDEARRSRAVLLRTFEGSTLSRANFCVLKGLSEAALESQLALARQEHQLHAPPAPPHQRPADPGRSPPPPRRPR